MMPRIVSALGVNTPAKVPSPAFGSVGGVWGSFFTRTI